MVIDNRTNKVLTVAYISRESLAISLEEKRTCFWSRSRQELWRKGETSGNVQHIVRIDTDCDCDALTVYVLPEGLAFFIVYIMQAAKNPFLSTALCG